MLLLLLLVMFVDNNLKRAVFSLYVTSWLAKDKMCNADCECNI